ncbi:hypothetical protein MTO96_026395 [Rhipicephalus appendiculatus]
MDKLRRHRGAFRDSTTRLLSEASEILLQDTLPSSADLQERIDGLRDKDTALAELDKQIADALDGEEFDAEIVGALDYHERIVQAISRLGSTINARAPVGSTINETNQPRHAGRHISALCEIWGHRGTDSPQLTAAEPQEAAIQREKRVTTAPASSTRSSSVLLQTATVWAFGTRGRVPVRLLLDTGSQRTFIRKDLSQQLRLSCIGTEEVDIFLHSAGQIIHDITSADG